MAGHETDLTAAPAPASPPAPAAAPPRRRQAAPRAVPAPLTLSPALARRLAVARQFLAGPRPPADAVGLLALVRELGCLQLDPISAVARTHLLVLHSRLGRYDPADLDTLLWRERHLFEYWAHCASIVPTADYPLHAEKMRRHGTGDSNWDRHLRAWVSANEPLRQAILARLRVEGPLLSRQFETGSASGWVSTGWTGGRKVSQMLDYLWIKGEIMVADRVGGQKRWDLTERCLPATVPTEPLPVAEIVRQAAQRSLRALGVARPAHIQRHFLRGRYPGLAGALAELTAAGRVRPVEIVADGRAWPGPWYVHADDLPLLDRLRDGAWEPRTTLLSPFDNLLCDRARTAELFGFDFRVEIYVPKEQRRYGYYVMPILHGDRLIGRLDPLFDRTRRRLVINAVHAEPDAPSAEATGQAIAGAIQELAHFLGAASVALPADLPAGWAAGLRRLDA